MGKKRGASKAPSSSRPTISEDVGDVTSSSFESDFNSNLGHHYDKPGSSVPSKKRTIKAQSRDLFEADDNEMGQGWGMMMGGIEVVDASNYLVVRGAEQEQEGKKKEKVDVEYNEDDDSSDDEGDPDDEDPLDDCSISDEECDIVVLDPAESKTRRQAADLDEDEDDGDENDRFGEEDDLDLGDWGDDGDDASAEKQKQKQKAKVQAESTPPPAPAATPAPAPAPAPAASMTPAEKKRQTLDLVSSLVSGHHAGAAQVTSSWMSHASGVALPPIIAYNFSRLGYDSPLPIQAATLPPAMLGRRDIVGCAPTGSGKTLCYGVSCLVGILDSIASGGGGEREGLKALVLAPTRELALQVQKELQEYVRVPEQSVLKELSFKANPPPKKKEKKKKKKKDAGPVLPTVTILRVASLVGGLAAEKQARVLKNRPEIIVATPGRLWELVSAP